jgi:hypothetical protein
MIELHLPTDAEILVNRLDEPPSTTRLIVLVVRTPVIEVETRWDPVSRLFWLHAFSLHSDGKRSHVVAVRSAPDVRGVVAIATRLLRREIAA